MSRKIDFASLTLMDALDIAILIEDEAAERYGELASQLELHNTPEAAQFFRHMVTNEGKHADRLREQRKAKYGDEPVQIDASVVPEIEAPEYSAVRAFMTEHHALRIALASELRARDFYAGALEKVIDPDVRALFAEMHEEELEHEGLVKAALAKLPPEEEQDPDLMSDGPVSQ